MTSTKVNSTHMLQLLHATVLLLLLLQMPCLVHNGEAYTDSAAIVRYIEYFFPEPSLSPKALNAEITEAQTVSKGSLHAQQP
jgi:glutathione S-transferase